MPIPRKALVSLDATPYYHCVSRCVRRAFLCGLDAVSGFNFDHRRRWIEDRLLTLTNAFALNIAAYAIMSNHYHVVLHIDRDKALKWSDLEVIRQWHRLFSGTALSKAVLKGGALGDAEQAVLKREVAVWRERLMDVSWFMRCLNEHVARLANEEDHTSGRFWEGRFKSQALLDEAAILACMVYVDLNPIRAKIAATPEASEHTSIQKRIFALPTANKEDPAMQPKGLLPFVGNLPEAIVKGLPFRLEEYLQLVDCTGRIIRDDKRGAIEQAESPILDRLNIASGHWLFLAQHFQSKFKGMVGCYYKLKSVCDKMGLQRASGAGACKLYFNG